MSEGTPKAIEMKGIRRNATKIGVQDGQAEDLINLRFMDGSWRASGDGRLVHTMTGTIYQQLYVHTNVYHHLLGVDNGTLYWFAEIADDGVTFYPLDNTTDRSQWPEDKQGLPTARKELTTVVGDVWITQTGHLLTVIDGADDFEHFVFKTGEDKYIEVNMDVNGKQTDRSLYPFGQVHFNLYSDPTIESFVHQKQIEELDLSGDPRSATSRYWQGEHDPHEENLEADGFKNRDENDKSDAKFYHNIMVELFGEATKKNQFTRPFLALAAYRLYDGSYVYTSNPVFLFPREAISSQKRYVTTPLKRAGVPESFSFNYPVESGDLCTLFENAIVLHNDNVMNPADSVFYGSAAAFIGRNKDAEGDSVCGCFLTSGMDHPRDTYRPTTRDGVKQRGSEPVYNIKQEHIPVYCNGVAGYYWQNHSVPGLGEWAGTKYRAAVIGSDLCFSVSDLDFIKNNSDIVTSLCIFVTKQADLWPMEVDNDEGKVLLHLRTLKDTGTNEGEDIKSASIMTISYAPKKYDTEKITKELLHSPFYLLKEYNQNAISELQNNPIVDLTEYEMEGLLENLVQQKTLPTEALSRTTYLPKVSYMYNGRLHIADYKSHPFFGYPIDLFHLHNHSVKVEEGSYFLEIPNLADNNDEYLQHPKDKFVFIPELLDDNGALIRAAAPYFLVKVYIDTTQGEQIVTRYIPAYDTTIAPEHSVNYIEDLNPLLTYPDTRAKKMEIYYVDHYSDSQVPSLNGYYLKRKVFTLKPHPYLNIAYYIDPALKPIKLSSFDNWPVVQPL